MRSISKAFGRASSGLNAERANLDRRVVDIDAGGAGAAARGDAADGDVVGARVVDIHAGREARDVLKILDAANIHRFLGQRRDADRNFAEAFLVAGRRHRDFLQGSGGLVGRERYRRADAAAAHQRGEDAANGASAPAAPTWPLCNARGTRHFHMMMHPQLISSACRARIPGTLQHIGDWLKGQSRPDMALLTPATGATRHWQRHVR